MNNEVNKHTDIEIDALTTAQKLLDDLGVSYFLAVGGHYTACNNVNDDALIRSFDEISSQIKRKIILGTEITLNDVYALVQDLTPDKYGYYDPNPENIQYPKPVLYVTPRRNQLNICVVKEYGTNPVSVLEFFFRQSDVYPDTMEVKILSFEKGFIRFENMLCFIINTRLDEIDWSAIDVDPLVVPSVPEFLRDTIERMKKPDSNEVSSSQTSNSTSRY